MTAEFLRVPVATLVALRRQPATVESYLVSEPGGAREPRVDVDGVLYSLPKDVLSAIRALPTARRQRRALLWLRRKGFLLAVGDSPSKQGPTTPPASQPPRPRARPINIDKTWHGLHYLFCGHAKPSQGPLGKVILGGRSIGPSLGYGPCRFLTAHQVRLASAALARLNTKTLRGRFHPGKMARAKIYPGTWDDADLQYLMAAFRNLRGYFAKAAARDEAMLVYLV